MNALHESDRWGTGTARLLATLLLGGPAWTLAGTSDQLTTHTLFMGSNLLVGYKKGLYPVNDLRGASWVIEVNGEREEVPTKSEHLSIKAVPAMKLSRVSATISHLVAERGYTWGNDPFVRLTRDMSDAASLNFGSQVLNNQVSAQINSQASNASSQGSPTQGQFSQADQNALLNGANLPQLPGNGLIQRNPGISSAALAEKSVNSVATVYTPVTPGTDDEMYGRRGQSAGFDAMHVNFEIAADHVIKRPYIVTYTMFRQEGAKPGEVRNLIYAKELHQIGRQLQTVDLLEGGFPANFEVISFQVHIYEGQGEIATNRAPKRVELTDDETFEYLRINYLDAHKGETLAASPLWGSTPEDLVRMLKDSSHPDIIYVRVSKDGRAEGIFRDYAARESVDDPILEEAVGKVRFQPALAKGSPVEGVATIDFKQLVF